MKKLLLVLCIISFSLALYSCSATKKDEKNFVPESTGVTIPVNNDKQPSI